MEKKTANRPINGSKTTDSKIDLHTYIPIRLHSDHMVNLLRRLTLKDYCVRLLYYSGAARGFTTTAPAPEHTRATAICNVEINPTGRQSRS